MRARAIPGPPPWPQSSTARALPPGLRQSLGLLGAIALWAPQPRARAGWRPAGLSARGAESMLGGMTDFRLAERMGQLGTESAFEVLARAKALEAAGQRVIHLEIGEPDFPTADHISEAAIEALRAGQTHYVPAPGIWPLRESVAAFLERTGRLRTSPDRVVVTPGAKPIM